MANKLKLTPAQLRALRWARRSYNDNRVPPYVFRDYRTVKKLLKLGLIELWPGYGALMYRFTNLGLDALQ